MMRLPTFKYFAPGSAAEAAKILANEGPRAQLVAGGTDLYPNMKRRHEQPQVLVGLRAIPDLRGVRGTPKEGLVLGAGNTLTGPDDGREEERTAASRGPNRRRTGLPVPPPAGPGDRSGSGAPVAARLP